MKIIWRFNTFGIIIVDIVPRLWRFWRQIKHSRRHFFFVVALFFCVFRSFTLSNNSFKKKKSRFFYCETKASISVYFKQLLHLKKKTIKIFHFFTLKKTFTFHNSTCVLILPMNCMSFFYCVFVSVFCFSLYDVFAGAACSF